MVLSFKSLRFKLTSALLSVAVILILSLIFSVGGKENSVTAAFSDSDAKSFIESFGWVVGDIPESVSECLITEEKALVFEGYNSLQKSQGFDLVPYIGQVVVKYVFDVLNYSGFENSGLIKATVLAADGNVIGGDISSVRSDGFMHGFMLGEKNGKDQT